MKVNTSKNWIVLWWYDIVAYHELIQSPARIWNKKYVTLYEWNTYYFRNNENKMLFDAHPQKYIPQYWWYCATAMSEWNAVPVDPETFLIQDGKLYLFYNDVIWNNTLWEWNSNLEERKKSANTHWLKWDIRYLSRGVVFSSFKTIIKNFFR